MALTLLFDLDDTLLENNIDTFLPVYLTALGKHLSTAVAPDQMIPRLLSATQIMLKNNRPGTSLENAFDEVFYPSIFKTKDELREGLDYFYDEVFPGLQTVTKQRPAAIRLVKDALLQGNTVVVATNPLFPRKAIFHRLRWAGLPPEETGFALITSYETFHFAKPNPAYYAEIMAQLGWPMQPAVVIGNSLDDDLLPAAQVGIPGFWVTDDDTPLPPLAHPLSAKGSLDEVTSWLAKVEKAGLKWEFKSPVGVLAVLRSTPAALGTLARQFSEKQWQQRPEPTEWSVTEILCHLRDVDKEVNLPRVQKILEGGNPFLPGINSDTWTDERKYCQQDGLVAVSEFLKVRSELIALLESLPAESWSLPARHAIFGPTNLLELMGFTATHDQSHIQQVCSAANQLS